MGAAFPKVVLHVPGGVEAQLVGQLDLLEGLPVRLLLGLPLPIGVRAIPRLGDVDFIEQVELHGGQTSVGAVASCRPAASHLRTCSTTPLARPPSLTPLVGGAAAGGGRAMLFRRVVKAN